MKTTNLQIKKDNGFTMIELEKSQKKIFPSLYTVGLLVSSILNGEGAHPLTEIGGREKYKLFLKVCTMVKPPFCRYFYDKIKNGSFKETDLNTLLGDN